MGVAQRDYSGEAADLVTAAFLVKNVNEANEGRVADLGSAINALYKEIEATRAEEVTPHREKGLAINEKYKPLLLSLKDEKSSALNYLKARVADWKLALQRERDAEAARIKAEEAARLKAVKEAKEAGDIPPESPPIREVPPPLPPNTSRGSFGKSVGRKNWKAECVNKKKLCQAIIDDKVPGELLEFQVGKAVSLARGGVKFDPEEVGVKAWQKTEQTFN